MKKFYTLLALLLFLSGTTFAQLGHSPLVQTIIDEITENSVSQLDRELSGDIETTINGNPYTIASRHYMQPGNAMAAEWIYEHFESFGYTVEYQDFGANGTNVIATKTGTDFPEQDFIICGHYDAMPNGLLAPGADDNASGTVATIEAARVLAAYDFPYTIKFIAWDEEEIGLIGSYYYANQAAANGDQILGVINLDMIGWDSDNDYQLDIATNALSSELTADYESAMKIYTPMLEAGHITTTASDHSSFWSNGYPAILAIEDMDDFHAYYHTTNDKFEYINVPYFHKMTQAAVAAFASLAWDFKMDFLHTPLPSGNFTDDRIATVVINSSYEAASPLLYYSVDQGTFNSIQPFYSNQDTFSFSIPAQLMDSEVNYYFAAQNTDATFSCTYPSGGRGINPPGSTSPEEFFSYSIADIENTIVCSESLPKQIEDFTFLYDTIDIEFAGQLLDLNVEITAEHTFDGDLEIYIMSPDGDIVTLSKNNGGNGENYTNTVFDDEAATEITFGNPPFTGSYQPQGSLASLDGTSLSGQWILIIKDNGPGDTGFLTQYCLHLQYSANTVGISEKKINHTILHQNYPNPASTSTTIPVSLQDRENISIDIFDIYGRWIQTAFSGTLPAGEQEISIDVSDLKTGQYFFRLQSSKTAASKSFMIIK